MFQKSGTDQQGVIIQFGKGNWDLENTGKVRKAQNLTPISYSKSQALLGQINGLSQSRS